MKQRKTRQQKIIADLRRRLQATADVSTSTAPQVVLNPQAGQAVTYKQDFTSNQHLLADLSKTFFLTTIIIVAEFFLFVLLKNRVFVLPTISF